MHLFLIGIFVGIWVGVVAWIAGMQILFWYQRRIGIRCSECGDKQR